MFKIGVLVVILPLSMLELPFLELFDILGLDSGIDAVETESFLSGDDIIEFFHFKIDSLEDLWFGYESGKFIDFVKFGFEFL